MGHFLCSPPPNELGDKRLLQGHNCTEQIARPQLKLYSSFTLYSALNSFLRQEFGGTRWENPLRQAGSDHRDEGTCHHGRYGSTSARVGQLLHGKNKPSSYLSNCMDKLNLVPSNQESPLCCYKMTGLWPSHIPFGSKVISWISCQANF